MRHGIPLVALLVCAGELGFPTGIPVEVALLLTGAYAVHSLPVLVAAVVAVSAADLLGTTLLHLAVRTGGVRLLDRLRARHPGRGGDLLAGWRRRMGGHDAAVVFVVRLLPMARMYVSIGTGLLRIRFRSFFFGAAPAAFLWAGTPLVAGYLFSSDAQRLAARYAAFTHAGIALLPAWGLLTAGVIWLRHAHLAPSTLLRGRAALGVLAGGGIAAYAGKLLWTNQWAIEHGSAGLPRSVLALWIAAMVGAAALLLAFAVIDARAARTLRHYAPATWHRMVAGAVGTATWLALVTSAGVIPIVLELRYPAI